MASITPMIISLQFNKPRFPTPHHRFSSTFSKKRSGMVVVSAATSGQPKPKRTLAEEMKMAAMKLHKPGQAKDTDKEAAGLNIAKWAPTLEGYLNFLANTRLVYEALERIVEKAVFPEYAEFRNTGLERSEKLEKDVEWFQKQGHTIPPPSSVGVDYANYLEELSEKDPQAFLCHYYMTYFGHTAGGKMIGRKVEEKILEGKELEFYKHDGELPQLLQNVRDKLNKVGERWSKEEKDRCLNEFENSFNLGGDVLRLVLY